MACAAGGGADGKSSCLSGFFGGRLGIQLAPEPPDEHEVAAEIAQRKDQSKRRHALVLNLRHGLRRFCILQHVHAARYIAQHEAQPQQSGYGAYRCAMPASATHALDGGTDEPEQQPRRRLWRPRTRSWRVPSAPDRSLNGPPCACRSASDAARCTARQGVGSQAVPGALVGRAWLFDQLAARRSSECGIGRPIALAVFTFMINSNRLSLVTSCSCIYCRPHPEWGVWGIMQDPRLVCQPGEHQPQTPQRARLASCSDGGSGRRERNSTRPLLGSLTSSASGGARAARSAVSCDGRVCRLRSGERTRRKPRGRGGRRRRRSDLAV
jgi:hypothetical protein